MNAQTKDWRKLMLFDFTTRKWLELADFKNIGWANWSRDGKYIYFDAVPLSGPNAFFRLRVSDRKLDRLVDLGDNLGLTTGSFGSWTGLAPDDSPLVLRNIMGTQEIYALDWEAP